jgi:hypothetical protein
MISAPTKRAFDAGRLDDPESLARSRRKHDSPFKPNLRSNAIDAILPFDEFVVVPSCLTDYATMCLTRQQANKPYGDFRRLSMKLPMTRSLPSCGIWRLWRVGAGVPINESNCCSVTR